MASKDANLDAMLWLTPIAKDLLRDVSKTLRGVVPSQPAQLAKALGDASDLEGLLANADIKKALVKEIGSLKGEVSDKNAASLVDALGSVLAKELEAVKKKVDAGKKKGAGVPGFKDLAANTQLANNDVMVWTSTATTKLVEPTIPRSDVSAAKNTPLTHSYW